MAVHSLKEKSHVRMLSRLAVLVLFAVSAIAPLRASAATLPLSVGIGAFLPTSTGSSLESIPTPGSVSVNQHGDLGLELAIEPNLLSGGYRIAAGVLSSHETVSTPNNQQVFGGPFGPVFTPGTERITQIPITFEQDSGLGKSFRLGGGFGYDFVSISGVNNGGTGVSRPGNGFVVDAFGQIAVGSSATLEAKYYINEHSALSGLLIGLTTRL